MRTGILGRRLYFRVNMLGCETKGKDGKALGDSLILHSRLQSYLQPSEDYDSAVLKTCGTGSVLSSRSILRELNPTLAPTKPFSALGGP